MRGYDVAYMDDFENISIGDTPQAKRAKELDRSIPRGKKATTWNYNTEVPSRVQKPTISGAAKPKNPGVLRRVGGIAALADGAVSLAGGLQNQANRDVADIQGRGGFVASTLKDAFPTLSRIGQSIGEGVGRMVHGPIQGEATPSMMPAAQAAALPQATRPTVAQAINNAPDPNGIKRNAANAIDSREVTKQYDATRPTIESIASQVPGSTGVMPVRNGVQLPGVRTLTDDMTQQVAAGNKFARANKQDPSIANMEFASRGMNVTKSVGKDGKVEYHDRTANPYIDETFTAPNLGGAFTGRQIGQMNQANQTKMAEEARMRELPTIARYVDKNAINNEQDMAAIADMRQKTSDAQTIAALRDEWLSAVQSGDKAKQAVVAQKLQGLTGKSENKRYTLNMKEPVMGTDENGKPFATDQMQERQVLVDDAGNVLFDPAKAQAQNKPTFQQYAQSIRAKNAGKMYTDEVLKAEYVKRYGTA